MSKILLETASLNTKGTAIMTVGRIDFFSSNTHGTDSNFEISNGIEGRN